MIREIPFGTTTESLIASIEDASQKGRVKITGIDDFTTDKVEIELALARGVYAEEVIPQLYAYTECEVSLSSSVLAIREQKPVELTVNEVLEDATSRLREQVKAELEWDENRLIDRQHWMTLERIFIENRVYKKIETAKTEEKVFEAVHKGMAEFRADFVRDMNDDDVKRLLEIRIRRISAYDIEKHASELEAVLAELAEVRKKLKHLTKTVIAWLEGLIEKYGEKYKRRTKVTSIDEIDKKAVATANLRLSYDDETGFFGSDVRGSDFALNVSEYDRVLAVSSDGTYRIMPAPKKVLLPRKVLCGRRLRPREGEGLHGGLARRRTHRLRQARAHPELHPRQGVPLLQGRGGQARPAARGRPRPGRVHLQFVAAKRQRQKECDFDLGELEFAGLTARGQRLAPKPVARVKHVPVK